MKKVNSYAVALMMMVMCALCVACGSEGNTIILGTYNETNSTFTEVPSSLGYSIEVDGETITLNGTIPYSAGVLGIQAGNIVAIKIIPNATYEADDETYVKTTNRNDPSGWNTYDKTAIEEDGSVIWVTSVSKENTVQIKIKWNEDAEEITYTLEVDDSATLNTSAS